MKIRIGHPAYESWCYNHAVYVDSKSAAVRELQNRFVPRGRARTAINKVVEQGYGGSTYTTLPSGLEKGIEIYIYPDM